MTCGWAYHGWRHGPSKTVSTSTAVFRIAKQVYQSTCTGCDDSTRSFDRWFCVGRTSVVIAQLWLLRFGLQPLQARPPRAFTVCGSTLQTMFRDLEQEDDAISVLNCTPGRCFCALTWLEKGLHQDISYSHAAMRARGVVNGFSKMMLPCGTYLLVISVSRRWPALLHYVRWNSLPNVGSLRCSDKKICLETTISVTSSEAVCKNRWYPHRCHCRRQRQRSSHAAR